MFRTERLQAAVALLLFALVAVAGTWPLGSRLTRAVPIDAGDSLFNTWVLSWVVHALTTEPARLFQANIFFPLPDTLAYSEHLLSTALLTAPVQLVSGAPLLVYNTALLLSLVLSAWGAFLLARELTGQTLASLAAGIVYGFGAYRFATLTHLQLQTTFWLPLLLLAIERHLRSGRRRYLGAAGLLWLGNALSSWHLALFGGAAVAIWLGVALLDVSVRRRAAALSATLVLASLLLWPVALPYLRVKDGLAEGRAVDAALEFSATPSHYLAASPYNRLWGGEEALRRRETDPSLVERELFQGYLVMALALVGALGAGRRRPGLTLALIVLAGFLFSLGPAREPYGLLYRHVPLMSLMRVPARWAMLVHLGLSLLAAIGLAGLVRRVTPAGRPLGAVAVVLLALEGWSAPLELVAVPPREELADAYQVLAELPGEGGLLELPLHVPPGLSHLEAPRMYASTLHWRELVNGYSGALPARQRELARQLACFPESPALEALERLRAQGLRYVLLDADALDFDWVRWERTGVARVQTLPGLQIVGEWEGVWLLELTGPLRPGEGRAPEPLPGHAVPLGIEWPEGPRLLGYRVAPGGEHRWSLVLYWTTDRPIERGWTVFVHVLNEEGRPIALADAVPQDGAYPTYSWCPGTLIEDEHVISTDMDPRSQQRTLIVGWYDPVTGERALRADGSDRLTLPSGGER